MNSGNPDWFFRLGVVRGLKENFWICNLSKKSHSYCKKVFISVQVLASQGSAKKPVAYE